MTEFCKKIKLQKNICLIRIIIAFLLQFYILSHIHWCYAKYRLKCIQCFFPFIFCVVVHWKKSKILGVFQTRLNFKAVTAENCQPSQETQLKVIIKLFNKPLELNNCRLLASVKYLLTKTYIGLISKRTNETVMIYFF